MADASARRYHAEIVEGLLAPAQEFVAFAVALHLHGDVLLERLLATEAVDHHRMIDHQVHGRQGVDSLRIATRFGDRITHCREVDHGRHAGEVLHQHPRGAILDLAVGAAGLQPGGQCGEILGVDGQVVFPAQQVFQQHLERGR